MSIERARQLRKNLTDAECKLWKYLRRKQIDGHRFRRQVPIGPYYVDFLCLERRLIIEVDGGQHADRRVEDARRTAWLESQDFRVLRYWNNEVLQNFEGVVEAILLALRPRLRTPLPGLPPQGGEGKIRRW
jgi:very-short-patch-repair endonuclease